ncbi:MAG TPA: secondary thiamine-phosphate synthase enzyme YjbQ [Candidatus Kapabacteria bacterium]|nr:secondary thiamine-phosphate synthase enzyme YjbQ [Candidatus Kapabacteria bacterium]
MIRLHYIETNTLGRNEMVDITDDVRGIVDRSDITDGHVLIFVPGATGALSTIEYEPGLIADFPEMMEKMIPEKKYYHHNETWHDGNGHSHLRATLVGPSLTVPFENRRLILGTWQQIVFLEFDNKPHRRRIALQLMGE